MASNTETGHAIDLGNFKLIIDHCNGFGDTYNPSNSKLTVGNMTAQWTAAGNANQTVNVTLEAVKIPISQRKALFDPLDKLVTRIINNYNSTEALRQLKDNAKSIADRIRGMDLNSPLLPNGSPDPDFVSNSHQSYVQKADAFFQLISLLGSDASNYDPNEEDLTLEALGTLYLAMKAANDSIGVILEPLDTARITRNNLLYAQDTGIHDISLKCKSYVKSIFGATSPQARLVTGIPISNGK